MCPLPLLPSLSLCRGAETAAISGYRAARDGRDPGERRTRRETREGPARLYKAVRAASLTTDDRPENVQLGRALLDRQRCRHQRQHADRGQTALSIAIRPAGDRLETGMGDFQ